MKRLLKIGIVGGGAIGSSLAKYCRDELSGIVRLIGVYDLIKEKSTVPSLERLIKSSDLVVEAASAKVAAEVLEKAVRAKKDVMIISAGGLINRTDLLDLAIKNDCKVYIPSGAICGLDGIKAAALKRIDSVTLTTKKPPEGLRDAPYIREKKIDLDSINDEAVVFEGTASDAIRAFPKNINVSATLSLVSLGPKKTKVRIVCVPRSDKNIHEIELKGECGNIFIRTENVPSPDNPKTSLLAILSAMAALKAIAGNVRIGT